MDLLLHPDVYIEYFKSIYSVRKSTIHVHVSNLLNNINNRFILSKSLIQIIEKDFSQEDIDVFVGPFLTQLISNNVLSIKGEFSDDIVLMTESMIGNYLNSDKPKRAIFLNFCLLEKNSFNKIKPNIVIGKASCPDINWVLFQLACNNPQTVTIRYFDFSSNYQITKLFEGLFLNISQVSDILVFDRQANLDHSLFNLIKNRNILYYTSKPRKGCGPLDQANEIKSVFKKVKIFEAKTDQIHERKILIENLIIETDDDFWNLVFNRPTWKIDIVYCSSTSQKLKEKTNLFKRVRIN